MQKIYQIKDGILSLKELLGDKKDIEEEYKKLLKNDYTKKCQDFILIDYDKRDIRPYARFLLKNKKEKLRGLLIILNFFITVLLFFMVAFISSKVSSTPKTTNNTTKSQIIQSINKQGVNKTDKIENIESDGKGSGLIPKI